MIVLASDKFESGDFRAECASVKNDCPITSNAALLHFPYVCVSYDSTPKTRP